MDAPLVWLVVSVVRLRGEHIAAKLSSKIEDLSSALTRGTLALAGFGVRLFAQ